MLKFGGMLFHKKCFTCEQCGTKLNGKRANQVAINGSEYTVDVYFTIQIPVTHGNSVLCRKHANEREKRLSLEVVIILDHTCCVK